MKSSGVFKSKQKVFALQFNFENFEKIINLIEESKNARVLKKLNYFAITIKFKSQIVTINRDDWILMDQESKICHYLSNEDFNERWEYDTS